MESNNKYCNSLTEYSRFKSRVVNIGNIPLGGIHPIRIQSMTTTNTMDTEATVEQTIRLVNVGCEYVRITAPSINEADNLKNIKAELNRRGVSVPLIADIHFTPNAALAAAKYVEKVRVNPGNYVDKKKFQQIEYSDKEYSLEIEKIRDKFSPLVRVCKEFGTAMRIGTNHGSLSDRILSKYGDTPMGMVVSALEFVNICRDENYHDIVLSMKASNTRVMIAAYRLLVNIMMKENMNYPIHLGVTEAGDGEDGRIKSALGIGALLEDGIGDTIRVSLTEEPEAEIPVAKKLVERYDSRVPHNEIPNLKKLDKSPFDYSRRSSKDIQNIGGNNVPVIINDLSKEKNISHETLERIGYTYNQKLDKWQLSDFACDYIYLGEQELQFIPPPTLGIIIDSKSWFPNNSQNTFPMFSLNELSDNRQLSNELNFVRINIQDLSSEIIKTIKEHSNLVLVLESSNKHWMPEIRRVFQYLEEFEVNHPVILKRSFNNFLQDRIQLYSSTDLGSLLNDGYGDGILIEADLISEDSLNFINRISFGILQAARVRISKTEYIACPSCGRTLFDLVEITNKIRERTSHLKGVKIGIMGCIVNGPGEMADADYGYVGSGIGKITLYRGKEIVSKNIDSVLAVDALIDLIKKDGAWVDAS